MVGGIYFSCLEGFMVCPDFLSAISSMMTIFCRQLSLVKYRKSSIKPNGGLIYFKPIWGGVESLFNLETTRVSFLQKELEYKAENSSTRSWRSCSQGSESNPNFQLVIKPSRISPEEVLQSWLINTGYHLLVKNN